MEKKNLPKIQDLYLDKEESYKNDVLLTLLNNEPKKEWVKEHPFIRGYKYLPIDKIEFLLQKIFKKYRIEILREGTSFNGVYVVVRVWYQHPITNEMEFHDGIGASQLQTAKGTSPSDLININNGALSMAYPMAKTIAIKDACDHFGNLFGANLNRKDVLNYSVDATLSPRDFNLEITEAKTKSEMNKIWSDMSEKEQKTFQVTFQNKYANVQ
jgi:hypothetical protein